MKRRLVIGIVLSWITLAGVQDGAAQSEPETQLPQQRRTTNSRNVQQMPTNRRQAAVGDSYRVRPPAPAPRVRIRPGYSRWRLGVNTADAPLGLRIVNVQSWSPAYYAGLEPDDYILDVNGYPVGTYANGYFSLQAAFDRLATPEGWVELAVWNHRNRREEYMWVQLSSR